MHSSNGNGKGLRFAALIRVSTERQEQQGESLRTQRDGIVRDAERLAGRIVGWYGGQEHATDGWERAEVDRLIADADKGKFDAVIVAYADRWSRDNAKSKAGLEAFRRAGIRFYVGCVEHDLFDPQARLALGIFAEMGEFIALQQAKKSIESRIARARDGKPSARPLPYGRLYDPAAGWSLDPEKHRIIQDAARRYVNGEPLSKIGPAIGLTERHLRCVLIDQAGAVWVQEFACKKLNIREAVPTPIPALLDPETIGAVRRRADANRTYEQGRAAKTKWLLSGFVYCSGCGFALSGQKKRSRYGVQYQHYYRHNTQVGARNCRVRPHPWVPARDLEDAVLRDLFSLFGNPAAVQRAVEAATPNDDKIAAAQDRLRRATAELEKAAAAKARVVRSIANGVLTEAEAAEELKAMRSRESAFQAERDAAAEVLKNLPTGKQVRDAADMAAQAFKPWTWMWSHVQTINEDFAGLSFNDARALLRMIFDGTTPDGRRQGVYISPPDGPQLRATGRKWSYRILGRTLVDLKGHLPKPPFDPGEPIYCPETDDYCTNEEFQGGPLQEQLLAGVTAGSGR
jgi:DNA invertase Pin-like site-specific DNA recombinase